MKRQVEYASLSSRRPWREHFAPACSLCVARFLHGFHRGYGQTVVLGESGLGLASCAPEPLAEAHELAFFQSGELSLDDWLWRRALTNQRTGASRTYVLAEGKRVVGYYALAAGAVTLAEATGKVRRNMSEPIPVMVFGRLAVNQAWQGQGLGLGSAAGHCAEDAPDGGHRRHSGASGAHPEREGRPLLSARRFPTIPAASADLHAAPV